MVEELSRQMGAAGVRFPKYTRTQPGMTHDGDNPFVPCDRLKGTVRAQHGKHLQKGLTNGKTLSRAISQRILVLN